MRSSPSSLPPPHTPADLAGPHPTTTVPERAAAARTGTGQGPAGLARARRLGVMGGLVGGLVGSMLTATGAHAQTSSTAPGPWARTTAALASTADTLSSGWDQGHWRTALSPYAPHLRYSPEHADVWAVALERQRPDHWMAGASFFSNSFGQPSGYGYLGRRFPQLLGHEQLFGQLSGGLLYGYRGKYQNKVPFNHNGYSPGALASVGWQFNRQASLTVHAIGDAAVMFQFAWDWR